MQRISQIICLVLFAGLSHHAMAQALEAGQLLIANPSLADPNFGKTVLLLFRHEDDGSLAVALNRPTWVDPAEAFPEIESLTTYREKLFFGGPIGIAQLLAVFESSQITPTNALRVIDSIYVSPDLTLLDQIDLTSTNGPRVRIFAGHAEWAPGQLEQEVAAGNWRVLPAEAAMIFSPAAADLWDQLPRLGNSATAALRE
jgi:putative transcriptional regulator